MNSSALILRSANNMKSDEDMTREQLLEKLAEMRQRIVALEEADTERQRAEEALQRSERYYRSLIRNAGDMITVLNPDYTLRWGSRSAGRITGYRPEELYGKPLSELVHPEEVAKVEGIIREVLDTPGASGYFEHRFRHADGTYHMHEVIITNLLDDPSVRGLVINSRDITERKKMEEELTAHNQELDAFAYTVSHDLRTPLALIQGYAQLMRAEDTTELEKEGYLKSIISAASRMDGLTEALLEYAQAGQPGGEATAVDPAAVLKDVLLDQASTLELKHIEVVTEEDMPGIMVDSLKLHQVFANLLSNAIKYIGDYPQPRIEIGARKEEDSVILHVRDNGPGIESHIMEEIFLPFRRYGNSSSFSLGIGLSTVKRAVEGWGGRIWVESTSGEGATFFFTAPASSE
jgi:PAS domain S-box-containing protein